MPRAEGSWGPPQACPTSSEPQLSASQPWCPPSGWAALAAGGLGRVDCTWRSLQYLQGLTGLSKKGRGRCWSRRGTAGPASPARSPVGLGAEGRGSTMWAPDRAWTCWRTSCSRCPAQSRIPTTAAPCFSYPGLPTAKDGIPRLSSKAGLRPGSGLHLCLRLGFRLAWR